MSLERSVLVERRLSLSSVITYRQVEERSAFVIYINVGVELQARDRWKSTISELYCVTPISGDVRVTVEGC